MKRGIAAAIAALFPTGSPARGLRVGTVLTIVNEKSTVYEGNVGSDYAYCVPHRTVTVVDDENGNGIDRSDPQIGIARTDQNGDYRIVSGQVPQGDHVFARVAKKKLPNGAVCTVAQDLTFALEG